MKRKVLIFVCFISCFISCAEAQKKPNLLETGRPRNDFNVTLGGNGADVSLNYEKIFFVREKGMFITSLGIGTSRPFENQVTLTPDANLPEEKEKVYPVLVPISAVWAIGKKRHFLDVGFGSFFMFNTNSPRVNYFPLLGYRFQPLKSGKMNFRLLAIYPLNKKQSFLTYWFSPVGISFGYCF